MVYVESVGRSQPKLDVPLLSDALLGRVCC